MTLSHLKLTIVLSALASIFGLSLPAARADHYSIMHSYARALESQAERVEREVDSHFSALPFSRELKSDVCAMARLADHIHDLADEQSSLRHMQSDLRELDARFHEVEDVVFQMRRMACGQVACRHARPNEYYTRRLSDRVSEMGRTLHAMQDTLAALLRECDRPVIYRNEHHDHEQSHYPTSGYHPASSHHFDHHSLRLPVTFDNKHFSFSFRVR